MREILFRGKRADNGEWVEGAYFKHDTVRVCLSSDDPKPKHLIVKDGFCDWGFEPGIIGIEVDPTTVGQYIGIRDRNGQKIFEGDTVEVYDIWGEFECIGTVSWNDTFLAWHCGKPKAMYGDIVASYRVIGNIHENPELLEVDNG